MEDEDKGTPEARSGSLKSNGANSCPSNHSVTSIDKEKTALDEDMPSQQSSEEVNSQNAEAVTTGSKEAQVESSCKTPTIQVQDALDRSRPPQVKDEAHKESPNNKTQPDMKDPPPPANNTNFTELPSEMSIDPSLKHRYTNSENARLFQNALGEIHHIPGAGPADYGARWESMPTVGSSELYDEKNNLLVQIDNTDETVNSDAAAKGYTKVIGNEDTVSITSLDEKTDYLFDKGNELPCQQIDTTKSMLTDTQRVAYVGLARLTMAGMERGLRSVDPSGKSCLQSFQQWESRIIHKLYVHLGLSNEEQLMIEQLVAHEVVTKDLTPCLHAAQTVESTGIEELTDTPVLDGKHIDEAANVELSEHVKQGVKIDVRWTVLCDIFINLVADGVYDSRSRTFLELIGSELGVGTMDICEFERKVTDAFELEETNTQDWTESEIIEARRKKDLKKRYAYIGLATVGGGLILGLTGGLLAPVIGAGIAAGLSTIGITGTSGFLAGAGGAALVTSANTVIGAYVGTKGMTKRTGHVKTFEFRPLHNNGRVNLIITISGWMNGKEDDVRLPYSTIDPVMGDVLSVLWEPEMMQSMGQSINIVATEALTQSVQQILGATVLTALMSSIQLPMALSKLGYLLDNPWNVSLDRAWSAGFILADTIMKRNLGTRPVTLVGFSLGARVISSCLMELAKRQAYGLVQDVFLFGNPLVFKKTQFVKARSVVSGRFINGYSRKDWILGYLFRATGGGIGTVCGLGPIDLPHVQNFDVTEFVDGHMSYRRCMPLLLAECGWKVLSHEFDEVEDPDPDKLREKQRKLIEELNEEAVTTKKRSRWFNFGRNKGWVERAKEAIEDPSQDNTPKTIDPDEFLFDTEALQAEVDRITANPKLIFDMEHEIEEQVRQGEAKKPRVLGQPNVRITKPSSIVTEAFSTGDALSGVAYETNNLEDLVHSQGARLENLSFSDSESDSPAVTPRPSLSANCSASYLPSDCPMDSPGPTDPQSNTQSSSVLPENDSTHFSQRPDTPSPQNVAFSDAEELGECTDQPAMVFDSGGESESDLELPAQPSMVFDTDEETGSDEE